MTHISDEKWQQIVEALNMTPERGAFFNLTPEETATYNQAFRDAATMGGDAFLASVEREKLIDRDGLSAAERVRLEARQAVAMAIEEYFTTELLLSFDGPAN
jgi:hypothetical protein